MGRRCGGGGRSSASRSTSHSRGHSSGAKRSTASHAKAARVVKSNQRKGAAFEKRVTAAVKHTSAIRTSSVKTQVPTKHGRADVVAKTKAGKKVVYEAKNFNRNPVTKNNVKQVKGYAKDLHAKPVLVVSKSTIVPSTVKSYASNRGVPIMKC